MGMNMAVPETDVHVCIMGMREVAMRFFYLAGLDGGRCTQCSWPRLHTMFLAEAACDVGYGFLPYLPTDAAHYGAWRQASPGGPRGGCMRMCMCMCMVLSAREGTAFRIERAGRAGTRPPGRRWLHDRIRGGLIAWWHESQRRVGRQRPK